MDEVLAVIVQTADGVYAVDHEQRILVWNEAAERILGYQASDVLGRTCHDVLHGTPRPGCIGCRPDCAVLQAADRQETIPAYHLLSHRKDGTPMLLNVTVITPPRKQAVATIHLFRDASRLWRYETYVEKLLWAAARLPGPEGTPKSPSPALAPLTGTPLSAREQEVLYWLVQGQAPRAIAQRLCISYATVRNHLQAILRKLEVHSQREAVRVAMERALV